MSILEAFCRPIRIEILLHPLIKDLVLQLIHSRFSFEEDMIKQDRSAALAVDIRSSKLVSVKNMDATFLAAIKG